MNVPRGVRNNNPGNIRRSGDPWQGLAKDQNDEAFFQFSEPKWGIRALARILITYQDKHGLRTVRAIISRWAPPAENQTSAYVEHVAQRLEIDADEPIDVHGYRVLRELVTAIVEHENGVQPYTDAQIDAGLVLAGVAPPERPITETRTVKGAQVAAAATILGVAADSIEKMQPALPLLQRIVEVAPWLLAALALAGIGYVVWARIDDRRKGLR